MTTPLAGVWLVSHVPREYLILYLWFIRVIVRALQDEPSVLDVCDMERCMLIVQLVSFLSPCMYKTLQVAE